MLGPKAINLAKSQDKDFRIAIMNMLKDFKEGMIWITVLMKTQTTEWNKENSKIY